MIKTSTISYYIPCFLDHPKIGYNPSSEADVSKKKERSAHYNKKKRAASDTM